MPAALRLLRRLEKRQERNISVIILLSALSAVQKISTAQPPLPGVSPRVIIKFYVQSTASWYKYCADFKYNDELFQLLKSL